MQITTISEQEYLTTSYERDCELDDGLLIKRNSGEEPHSWLQMAIAAYLYQRRREWQITVYPEQRFRLAPKRYFIPDVAVISGPRATERIITQPPLIWIEILSPEDRPIRVNEKVRKVLAFGAPNVWVIDPDSLEAEVHTPGVSHSVHDGVLRVPGSEIVLPLQELDRE